MEIKGFVQGGIASIIAASTTHPLDLIKVRMQLQGENHYLPSLRPTLAFQITTMASTPPPRRLGPVAIGIEIVRREGVAALYSGISASILRQAVYSTTCLGLYDVLKKWSDPNSENISLPRKFAIGMISGGIGAVVGNPADVAMVRMQADGRLPPWRRRNYRSVFDAISRIVKQEGVISLWRGSHLTVKRAMLVAASQLASYDQIKETILKKGLMKEGPATHVTASLAAGFVAAVASTPVDVIKTRVMNMKAAGEKRVAAPTYSGALDCLVKTVRAEGFMALYKGFVPTISRQGPYTVVLFVTLEQVRKLLKDYSF